MSLGGTLLAEGVSVLSALHPTPAASARETTPAAIPVLRIGG